jgi:hypothetical protein
MNVLINGTPVNEMYTGAANLEDLIVKLSKTSVPVNHLVSNVTVNGKHFSELYPGQSREIGTDKIVDLNIDTVSLDTIAAASLHDSIVFLEHMSRAVLKTAELFRMYDETEANEHFVNVLESLRALFQFLDMIQKSIAWDFKTSLYNGQPVLKSWDKLKDIIDELKNIQDEGDWILLADLLEYELAPTLITWSKIFKEQGENINCK